MHENMFYIVCTSQTGVYLQYYLVASRQKQNQE